MDLIVYTAPLKEDPQKSPKRCVPALDFPYLDFFQKSIQILGDTLKFSVLIWTLTYTSKIFFSTFLLIKCSKIFFLIVVLVLIIYFRYPAFHYLDGRDVILPQKSLNMYISSIACPETAFALSMKLLLGILREVRHWMSSVGLSF